jgi:hypothetical protein
VCGCQWSYKETVDPALVRKHNCLDRFIRSQHPLPPEMSRILNEHFWELL